MTDEELINIYKEAYDNEFEEQFKLSHTFYEKARDKTYALKLGLFAISIIHTFRNSTDLDKAINNYYDHAYKLGESISDVIKTIPNFTQEYIIQKEEKEKTRKNKVKIEWNKLAGIIPYKIKTIHVKGAFRASSPFERITNLEDIASEFGKHRAILDLYIQLKSNLSELGVIFDEKQKMQQIIETPILFKLKTSLAKNDLDTLFRTLQGLFATISYSMKITEAYFHCLIHMFLKLSNVCTFSELETNEGRIDLVTENEKYVHIFEFKLNDCKIALNQIKEKKYYQSYFNSPKEIILVGVAFDKNKKNITNWTSEKFDKDLQRGY
jgi:hypothetical protein